MEFKHYSVMKNECLSNLNIKPKGVYMDGTLGGGGHSIEIGKLLNKAGKLIMFDLDDEAITASQERLKTLVCEKHFIHDNFKNFKQHLDELAIVCIMMSVQPHAVW